MQPHCGVLDFAMNGTKLIDGLKGLSAGLASLSSDLSLLHRRRMLMSACDGNKTHRPLRFSELSFTVITNCDCITAHIFLWSVIPYHKILKNRGAIKNLLYFMEIIEYI